MHGAWGGGDCAQGKANDEGGDVSLRDNLFDHGDVFFACKIDVNGARGKRSINVVSIAGVCFEGFLKVRHDKSCIDNISQFEMRNTTSNDL